MPPVMHEELFCRDISVHYLNLAFGHRSVCAESGHNVDLYTLFGQFMIADVGNKACVGMEPRKIWWKNQYFFQCSAFQCLQKS